MRSQHFLSKAFLTVLIAITLLSSRALATLPEFSGGICPYRENGSYGFINIKGKKICEPKWDLTGAYFSNYDYCVSDRCAVLKDGKWGFIDSKGNLIIPCTWDDTSYFSDGLAPVSRNGKWGFIDVDGKLVIQPIWDSVGQFNLGYAQVEKNGETHFVGKDGSVFQANPSIHEKMSLGRLDNTITITQSNGYLFYADSKGTQIGEYRWKGEYPLPWFRFSEGLAPVMGENNKIGYINREGNLVIPVVWDEAFAFHEGVATVRRDQRYGLIDETGRVIVEPTWEYMQRRISEGLLRVSNGAFINKKGKVVIESSPWTPSSENSLLSIRKLKDRDGLTLYASVVEANESIATLKVGSKIVEYPLNKLCEEDAKQIRRAASRSSKR